MEDPWASGGWGASIKSSASTSDPPITDDGPGSHSHRLPGEEKRHTPPPSFDVGDPWGVSATPAPIAPDPVSAVHEQPTVSPSRHNEPASSGWDADSHDNWGSGPSASPTKPSALATLPSPKQAEEPHDAVWSLNSPAAIITDLPPELPSEADGTDIPLPLSPAPSTPPPTFTSFPPASSSSHASPFSTHSLHSLRSPIRSIHEDIDQGFGSGVSLPKSPSFGDDFGGFSAGPAFGGGTGDADPWGSGGTQGTDIGGSSTSRQDEMPRWGSGGAADGDDWAGDMSFGTGAAGENDAHLKVEDSGEDEGDDDGWGGVRAAAQPSVQRDQGHAEWEEAQRRIKVKQERAPQEKIEALVKLWSELARSIGGPSELPKMTGAEEMQYEEFVKAAADDVYERLRSLSVIPPDINTYPPVISSLVTHERFAYALTRPNPTPSTSVLAAAATRKPRRTDDLVFTLNSASSFGESWTNRSRLGEPDAPTEAAPQVEENKSRWSFWGKKPTMERQLTTSGGGMLEVKQSTPTATGTEATASEPKIPLPFPRPSSRTASISSKPSRPTSPSPAITAAPTLSPSLSLPPSVSQESVGHPALSGIISQTPAPQPSAVSRFFGRLSRKTSSTQTQTHDEVDGKDLELSADDFSFLAEVPSITSPPPGQGVEDLLSLEGPTQPARSLDTVLNSSTKAPLPKPLAPPPSSGGVLSAPYMSSASRSASGSGSGKFVARMTNHTPAPTSFDLLGDLDFASPSSSSPSAPPAAVQTTTKSAWDDFLAFDSAPTNALNKPTPPLPQANPSTPLPTSSRSNTGTPVLSLSPPPPSATQFQNFFATPSYDHSTILATPKKNDTVFGGKDSDDFGTPQPANVAAFDDFGDFSAFDDPPPSAQSQQPQAFSMQANVPKPRPLSAFVQSNTPSYAHKSTPSSTANPSTPAHAKGPSLDHTPTLNLLSSASASKGRRWPAPPSPIAPALEPPPKSISSSAASSSAGFPFLSPPPPASGRPVSRGNNLLDDAEGPQQGLVGLNISSNGGTPFDPISGSSTSAPISQVVRPQPELTQSIKSPPMFGGALAPTPPSRSLTSTPISTSLFSSPPRQPTTSTARSTTTGAGVGVGGGLSAQDLSFFDSL